MIREIVKIGDEVLRKKCHSVEKFDAKLHALLDDMYETMQEANGVGLAAPQIGIFSVEQTIEFAGQVSTNKKLVLICPLWLLFVIFALLFFIIFWLVSRARSRKRARRSNTGATSSHEEKSAKEDEED